ncbi:MAG: hypothetical protein ACK4FB_02895 [Brevundimonas sp.]|uniref:hypothetical protein n=1 Tax=Brevundimonas sp. TaxID=1871086 RepID=UPI003919095E
MKSLNKIGVRPRLPAAFAASLGIMMCATAAVAAEPITPDASSFSRVDVILAGSISARCDVSGGGDIDFGELVGNQTARARVALDCNVPFDLSFQSARGGLAHTALPAGEGPYAGTLDYTLDVSVPVIGPRRSTLHGRYESRSLMSRKTLGSGDAIAAGHAQIEIRTGAPLGAGLLAGQYSETLTITVASRL